MAGRAAGTADLKIGKRIRAGRELVGISSAKLAHAIDTTPQGLLAYETGKLRTPASTLGEIAEVLKIPIGFFYGEVNAPRSPRR